MTPKWVSKLRFIVAEFAKFGFYQWAPNSCEFSYVLKPRLTLDGEMHADCQLFDFGVGRRKHDVAWLALGRLEPNHGSQAGRNIDLQRYLNERISQFLGLADRHFQFGR